MKTTISVTGEIELSYDENSKEFKESLHDYKVAIDSNADRDDLLKSVAHHVTRFGHERMIEGVGYVGYNGRKPEPFSGITLNHEYDEFDFVITQTEQ